MKVLNSKEKSVGGLTGLIECHVIEERNGEFELQLTHSAREKGASDLVRGNILVCNASPTLTNQYFRIYRVSKEIYGKIMVNARHISFDLARDITEGLDIKNQSCEYVLNTLFRNSQFSKDFRGVSDIINAQDFNIKETNLLSAIGGFKGSILDTFGTGAEILRDNKTINVLNRRGRDNGVTIEYAKNLTGFELTIDEEGLATRIKPFARYTPEGGEETIILSNPRFIDSPLIFNYETPFISSIDFTDKFKEGEIPTPSKLKALAEKYYRDTKCDIVKQNYQLDFIPLSKCVGFDNIKDDISLCDEVTVINSLYNITVKNKVIKTVFNVLTNRIESVELGEPRTTLGDVIGSGGESGKGEKGDKGDQGEAGADGNIGDFPDSLPTTPTLTGKVYGFANAELEWTFENKVYYTYELYASKEKDFTPNVFDLIFEGQASTFLNQLKPNETWYYRVCAVNTQGKRTEFSNQLEIVTTKIDDLSNYVDNMAIGDALIGELSLDRGWFGELRGNYIDAKQLSVTDGNGKRTLDIDSFGNVNLDVTSLKIKATDVEKTMSETNKTVSNNKTLAQQQSNKAKADAIKHANDLKIATDKEIKDVATSVGNLNTTMNGAFKDGIVTEAEAKAIKENLKRCDKEKLEADKQYNVLYADSSLIGGAKTNLLNAKNDYNSKYTDLTNYIREVIKDGKATTSEIKNVDAKNTTYNTSNAVLMQRVAEATKSIEDKKKSDAITTSNNHTNTQINTVNTKITENKSSIDVLKNQISLTVSEKEFNETVTNINNNVNNIQIGGKNHINNGSFKFNKEQWAAGDVGDYRERKCGILETSSPAERYLKTIRYKRQDLKQVTLSFIAAKTDNVTSFEVFILSRKYNSSSAHDYTPSKSFALTKDWQKFSWTYTFPSDVDNFDVRFDNNGSKDNKSSYVYVTDVKLESGNKVTDFTYSDWDNTNDISKAKDEAITHTNTQITNVTNSVTNLSNTMNGAFKDGVVNDAESKAIAQRIIELDKEKIETTKDYNALYTNTDLTGSAKTNLKSAYDDLMSKYNTHKNYINSAISDKKVTSSENATINTNTTNYNNSLALYKQRLQEGINNVAQNKANRAKNESVSHTNTEVKKTNDKVASIDVKVNSITQKVSQVESSVTTINGKVNSQEKRISSAEQKITPSAITSTVTSSQTYKNDLTGKVSTNEVVSSINQTAEKIKIKANKIELNGATTIGDNGRKVLIENANYTVHDKGSQRAFFGFKNMGNSYDKYVVPKLALGAYGYASQHNYFTVIPYRGGDNPQNLQNAYVDIAYHCISDDDWSNIKMYDGGDIRLAPIKNLEITTNHVDGSYGGAEERRLALFSSDKSKIFNSNLQIGCIRNKDNGMGLILGDDSHSDSNKWARVRVNTDSAGAKFFRPATQTGDIGCGSTSFPWKNVVTKTYYATDNIVNNPCSKALVKSGYNILDSIEFIQPLNIEEPTKIDVSAITGTVYAPVEEGTQAIDTTELLKLALIEIKQLKERVKILENK